MPSRILSLADFIKDVLIANVPNDVTVERKFSVTKRVEDLTGKHLWVFPLDYADNGPETRTEYALDVRIGVVYAERYAQPGSIPDEWLDDRVEFVELSIFDPLNVNQGSYGAAGEYWPQTAAVTTLYDMDALKQLKVFWTELEFVYRRLI